MIFFSSLIFLTNILFTDETMTKIFRSVIPIRELQREKTWSRIHLIPLLLAEGDRDAYRRQQAALAREKEIMKDVHGWEVGVHEPISGTALLLLFFVFVFHSSNVCGSMALL